nr:arginine vasopressin-induced protein 1 isoform X1 [Manis javanica]
MRQGTRRRAHLASGSGGGHSSRVPRRAGSRRTRRQECGPARLSRQQKPRSPWGLTSMKEGPPGAAAGGRRWGGWSSDGHAPRRCSAADWARGILALGLRGGRSGGAGPGHAPRPSAAADWPTESRRLVWKTRSELTPRLGGGLAAPGLGSSFFGEPRVWQRWLSSRSQIH